MASQSLELDTSYGCLGKFDLYLVVRYIIDDVSQIGVVEQIVEEAWGVILLEVLVVSEGADAQGIGQSPK